MAGRGPKPKPLEQRRTRHQPLRGEWQAAAGIGWQHGSPPEPPDGLLIASVRVWQTWMQSWWASHWMPEDLPGLIVTIRLYDMCESYFNEPLTEKKVRGKDETVWVPKPNPTTELRQFMDNYGITPKGQQDRRWAPPKADEQPVAAEPAKRGGRYAHLRSVG